MTTIAFDGTILAADRRCTDADARRLAVGCKITRITLPSLGPCRVGAAGSYASISAAVGEPSDETSLIAVDAKGRVWVRPGKSEWMRAPCRRWAIGSGGSFAIGALLVGASAVEAVRAAAKVDPCTGDGVDAL